MKSVRCFFTIIFLLLLINAESQNKLFVQGWVVLNSGDTLYGKILNKEWNTTPAEIKFKKGNKESIYTIQDLSAFGADNDFLYHRFQVSYHLTPINENEEYSSSEDSIKNSVEWLKIIVNANVSLGQFINKERTYFYFIQNGKATELVYSKGLKDFSNSKYQGDPRYGKTLITENFSFRQQLYELNMDKSTKGDISNSIATMEYNAFSLSFAFSQLNQVQEKKSNGKSGNSFIAGIGISSYTHHVSGSNGSYLQNASLNSNISPLLMFGYMLKGPSKSSWFSFYQELMVSTLNTTGSASSAAAQSISFNVKNTFLELQLLPTYTFNPYSDLKFAAGIGVDLMFKASSKNVEHVDNGGGSVQDFPNIPSLNGVLACPVIAATLTGKHLGVFVNYQFSGNLTNYLNASWAFTKISGGLFYKFRN